MYYFTDFNGNRVRLSFNKGSFPKEAEHVLVICRYKNNWLLTNHKQRGLEFPGGKIEANETAGEAAIREVLEETGAVVSHLLFIGQYEVSGSDGSFVKNVYFAEIDKIMARKSYLETLGPVLLPGNFDFTKLDENFSFIMKDGVLQKCLEEIAKRKLI